MSENRTLKRLQLAKTGIFGMDGAEITIEHLRQVAETFQGGVPISLGHQMTKEDWWPSWGSVEALYLIEDENGVDAVLEGDISVPLEISQAIDEEFYPSWSVSIPSRGEDGKRYLHHLALLGSTPPKIKDLEVLATLGNPENSIDANGEGTSFSDQVVFRNSDFTKGKALTVSNSTFSDTEKLQRLEARAKNSFKEAAKEKVVREVGSNFPKAKEKQLRDFADKLCDVHDFDFADDKSEKSLCEMFIDIVKSMTSKPSVGRSTSFSDVGDKVEKINRAELAQKF